MKGHKEEVREGFFFFFTLAASIIQELFITYMQMFIILKQIYSKIKIKIEKKKIALIVGVVLKCKAF